MFEDVIGCELGEWEWSCDVRGSTLTELSESQC